MGRQNREKKRRRQLGIKRVPQPQQPLWWIQAITFCLMLFSFVYGTIFSIQAGTMLVLLPQSKTWPSVTGNVVQAEIRRISTGRPSFLDMRPIITYRYTVAQKVYENNVYRLYPEMDTTRKRAEEIVATYPPQTQVQVFYNPANPQQSYLQQGFFTAIHYLGLIMFVGMALLGGLYLTVLVYTLFTGRPLGAKQASQ